MSDIIKPLPCVNSETNDKAMRAILDGVDYLMTKEIKDAPFDKVYTGIIKTVNSDNTYDLTIGGNLYKGVPSMFKASFAENDIVKVVSPQNQMGNIFIFGKMNMEVSGSNKVTSVAWDVISDKPSDLVQDASYTHTDNNYTTEEKNKLKAIEEGAQKNTVTGVKGDVETSYREGNVNITKANIGLDKVDNTADADKSVENASKLNNQLPSYYATAQSVADENERATIAEQENSALIDNETKRAKSVESDLSSKLTDEIERAQKAEKVNSDAIDVLNGEATVEGSVAYKIAQIVNENDNGSIDTLKEIASWIDNNPNSATAMQKQIAENKSAIDTHIKNTANPHKVTKSQIGLGNVDNTSDADKPISTATQKALDLKTNLGDFNAHIQNTGNPHNVTASQVGLGNVPNVNTNDQTPTYNNATKLTALTSGEKLSVAFGKIAKAISDLINHIADTSNPHKVTKSQIGLGSVSNYDQSKAIKSITRNGLTFTCTKLDGTTETFTQQDKNDNTTYTLTQDSSNGHILYFTPSNGTKQTITIPDKDTTYELASQTVSGLMSYNDKKKLDGIESGAQKNTVTGIKGDSETSYRNGNVNITKANIGLGNVENKSSATIRSELTKANVVSALGYTPPQQDTNTTYSVMVGASTTKDGAEGLVTKPTAGSLSRYLRVDGGWETPPDTTDLTKMSGILSVAHGGTGATDAKTARANLGITKDNLGIANVTNYDQSKAIKSITRNGTTYTATRLDGTTFTFTQQDKDTIYSLPLATNGTRGGVQIGYSQNGKNYPVQLSSEKMFVNVPWTDHYDWGDITGKPTNVGASNRGIYLNGTTFTAVSWYPNYCTINGGNTANFPWHRIATCTTGTGQFVDRSAIVVIHSRYNGGAYGMIKICVRTNSSKTAMDSSAVWLFRYGFNVGDVIITSGGTTGTDTRFNVWLKCGNWPRRIAYILEGSNNGWSLVNSWEPDNCTSASQGAEIYASVSGNVAIDGANVNYANSAGNGISNITRSGTTFTVTRANGTTFTFTQQDNDTKALGSMTGTLAIGHGGTGATTASGARTNLGIGTLGTKNVIEKGDLTLKAVNGNTLQLVNSAGTVISSMLYTPKIEWNQSTFTSYVWNE